MTEDLKPLIVGLELYALPRRAKVVHVAADRLAMVLFEGELTLLTRTGEIAVPDANFSDLLREYFPRDADRLLR